MSFQACNYNHVLTGHRLTREEEAELGRRIRAGDQAARQELVHRNLPLVLRFAKKCQGRGLPLADLIQSGTIGLLKAADRFDATLGFRFSTYAMFWIRQAIGYELETTADTVRVPAIRWRAGQRIAPPVNDADALAAIPNRGDEQDPAEALPAQLDAAALLASLPPREREVLLYRFFQGLTLHQTGAKLGVSKERIRQIEAAALGRLREALGPSSSGAA